MSTLENELEFTRPPSDQALFRKQVQHELDEICKEIEEACAVAEDVYRVPESAYEETFALLEQMPRDTPMPDLMWLEAGGIGLEWRPGDGIITISLYGDDHVNFVVVLDDQHEIAGTCPLSDPFLLPNFLTILPELFQRRT